MERIALLSGPNPYKKSRHIDDAHMRVLELKQIPLSPSLLRTQYVDSRLSCNS